MTERDALSRELQLLVCCDLGTDAQLASLVASASRAIDWQRFQSLVSFNAMGGLVARRMAGVPAVDLPVDFATYLADRRHHHAAMQLAHTAETARIAEAARAAHLDMIVLKGAALARQLHAAHPTDRYSSDIDLLVAPEMLDAAARLLAECGYDCTAAHFPLAGATRDMRLHLVYAFAFVHRDTGLEVELHHRLTANPCVLPQAFAEMRAACIPVDTPSGSLTALEGPLLVAYLAWHALGHTEFRVKWLSDLARAALRLDDDARRALLDRSEAWGVADALRLATSVAHALYRDVLDPAALARLDFGQPPGRLMRDRARILEWLEAGHALATARSLARLPGEAAWLGFKRRLLRDPRARRYEVLRALSDPRDVERLGLSRRWSWAYAALGPVLAAGRYVTRSA